MNEQSTSDFLPLDGFAGTLIGRAWLPAQLTGSIPGPSPVLVAAEGVYDLSPLAPTCAELLNSGFRQTAAHLQQLARLGNFETIMANTMRPERDPDLPTFLSPVDLQSVKACGVTFMVSMLERVIEERAGGDAARAAAVREKIKTRLGADLTTIRPGSAEAQALKELLLAEGLWSQYIEVGIGPYAEVFTKAQPLSTVGPGAEVGILAISSWNNPEPEVVLLVNALGDVVGAALGNDVNLRDLEGRSALLLGKAKDNNASCAIGPFIRLLDDTFTLDDIRVMELTLTVAGEDGFRLQETSPMNRISRDILDLVAQTINENHQYPDGLALFTGTLFAPTQDRAGDGQGFTHHVGDVVTISAPALGALQNRVTYCHDAPPWQFGLTALMHNLGRRGLL
ncbi:MAG: fumarylacetoacetate hydrolase family protein [Candidatus Promineifilaceae bacterium]